ncbi:helix-turn-helix domain-containing protein [Brevibacillus sp. DP1.3A]|uniref:helix-turn-helix domain-containing protein n=1 Tax=Brevibacillus sp. DP1.3A TaxID=2738867 RepID=UPI00156B4017|nr:helix-turn-helix domain-containing protein [Brevibacillus sp. DP1.3A]MED1914445.1 helix-turn-helix domain-containing protein [Bacillus thuringiensis]UED74405.1 helix-turn-helix domain-containing protein [Brevibacillus sp. DP1.3A]
MIIKSNRLMTVEEAAYFMNLSTRTIYRKAYEGELLAYKVGGVWRLEPQPQLVYEYVQQTNRVGAIRNG